MLETFWLDLRHGARMLAKNPGFTLIAMVSIAIGVGANAAMFSVADTMVLRPLTVPRPSEIVTVATVVPRIGFLSPTASAVSYPDFTDVRDRARSFESLLAYRIVVAGFTDRPDGPAQRKFGMAVSGNLFDALGVQPALGRSFRAEEDQVVGRDSVVMLDHEMWAQQFGSNTGILGQRIRIGGVDMTVIGVTPRDFSGPDQFVRPGYYVPLAMVPSVQSGALDELERRDLRNLAVKGRLKPGVSITQAGEEATLIAADLERRYPDTNRSYGLTVRTEFDARVAARPPLAVLSVMLTTLALVVLIVACANVAGLLTSRAPARAREMALRLAIGAGRPRLIRQLLGESLLIATGGGALGLVVGYGIIMLFQRIQIPTDVPLKFAFELNGRVLVVAMVVATLSALLSSLVPAWRSTGADLASSLKPTAADARGSRLWGRNTLVCGQVALSLVLLTISVFLYRAYQAELERGPGFRTDRTLMMAFDPQLARFDTARTEAFYRQLTEKARTLPGVNSVALTSSVHMHPISIENTTIVPEGYQFPAGTEHVTVRSARVDEGYFDTTGIRIVSGRAFQTSDTPDAPPRAIVNQTVATRYWPGQDVIGRRFRLSAAGSPWIEIVGVAVTAKYRMLSEAPTEFVYYARRQNPSPQMTLLVETGADAASLAAPVREAVRSIEPDMPVFDVRTMAEFYQANTVSFSNLIVQTVGSMGSMGLVLALAGLYGLVAYSASRRTREIGIRIAVGAHPASVLWTVLRHGLALAAGGALAGVIASVAVGSVLRAAFPFPGVAPVDLTTYLVVVPALLAITLLAAYIPARRASRVDPLVALRQE